MAQADKHPFTTGLISGGRCAAVSTKAPYFFFVADTVEEVRAIANRALDLYFEHPGRIVIEAAVEERQGTSKSKYRPLEHV